MPLRVTARPAIHALAAAVLVCAGALAVTHTYSSPSLLGPLAGLLVVTAAAWFFLTERHEATLAVFLVYLGLLDGFLKLKTGSPAATIGRDVMLYALVAGIVVRGIVRRQPITLPPLSGWIFAWVAVVGVQIFNPANASLGGSLAALRPHLEFIPLFFLGYFVMRSPGRLRALLFILVFIAAINGVVSLVQYNLTPDQFAAWGPGYYARIGGPESRVFVDNGGTGRIRPFGLGSDFGFGGAVGAIAAPAALVLLGLVRRHRWLSAATALMSAGVVLAVVVSQARLAVVASVLAVLVYVLLATDARRIVPLLATLLAAVLMVVIVVTNLDAGGVFDRYSDIAPNRAVGTAVDYRSGSLKDIPGYAREFPLGAGLGTVGPAASFTRIGSGRQLNAEGELNYLILEVGIVGALVLLLFHIRLLALTLRIRRERDPQLRLLLSAVAAPLGATFAAWPIGIATAGSPDAPYLWFTTGILAYWLLGRRSTPADSPRLA